MKELLKNLLAGEGRLSLLLLQAKQYAEQAQDSNLIEFIDKELNGYSNNDLPDYRKIRATIIGTIKDPYGHIIREGEPINFSVLSKSIGFDLEETHIPDGIGFIEDGLSDLTSQMVERPIHHEIVKMLNDVFKYNNPNFNLTSAYHKFGKAAIQFILTKVRQDLIIGLQKISKSSNNDLNEIKIIESVSKDKQKIFVTYAWEDDDHNSKVISFVDFLRKRGYEASMDKKESQSNTALDFNEMMLGGLQNADRVIIVLSKKYKEKADAFKGGVGFEYKVILEQLKKRTNKFIFVSFGKEELEFITPLGIANIDILNLKNDQGNSFNNLFAKLESENIINFSDVSDVKVKVEKIEIKPFEL